MPPSMSGLKPLTRLPVAVAAAVVGRLGYVVLLAGTRLSDDEVSFWAIAGNVARGHGFSYQGRATAWRPPLYTALVAAARWAGASARTVELGQVALGAATPLLCFALARRLGASRPAATVAAWVGALYPPFVYFSGRILSENLDIPLYLLALWTTLEWLARRRPGWAVACGAVWGLAVLARPSNIPVLVVAAAVGAVAARGRRGIAQAALVVGAAAALVVPWMARNAAAVGGAEPVTSNEGITVWAPNRLDTTQLKNVLDDPRYPGMQDYSVYGRAFPGIEALARAKGFDFDHAGEAAQDAWFRSLAVAAVRADPGRFVVRTAERAALALLPAPDNASQTARTGAPEKLALWVTSGPVVLLGAAGLGVLARRRRDAAAAFVVLTAVGALALLAVHLPYVRYRVDGVDPVLIPAAAWLAVDGRRRVPTGGRGRPN